MCGMKRLVVTAALAALFAGVSDVSAETVVRYGGGGHVKIDAMTAEVVASGEGWSGSATGGAAYLLPDAKTGRITWTAKGSRGLEIACRETLRQEGDAVRFEAHVRSLADAKPECVAFSFNVEADAVPGWTWTVETPSGRRTHAVDREFRKVPMYGGLATAVMLAAPDGAKDYTWIFPAARYVTLQDSRKWGKCLTLRIGERPKSFAKGTEIPIAFTFGAKDGARLVRAEPVVVKAGPDWIPLDYRKSIVAGSVLDFSHMGFLDAPAGKYGWLRNAGGDFVFEGRPGVRQRFYGVNLCMTANTPSHELADDFIERLKRLGYNTIRLHHHERAITKNRLKEGPGFEAAKLDRFDYLVAKGIAAGFYFTTDVFVSRTVTWADVGLPERGANAAVEMQLYKALVAVWDPAFENWKAFAKDFFEHVNPYTGRAYRDEPAMPLISLINEGQITMGWSRGVKDDPIVAAAYRTWLAEKRAKDPAYRPEAPQALADLACYGKTGAAMVDFMADIERRSAARMKAYLRELGVKALVTNANNGPHPATMNAVRAEVYDYTDDHFYVDHPQFLKDRWRLPSRCGNGNPVLARQLPFLGCAFTRIAGEPMCITEWNFSGPGMFRGVGGILTGAFGAIQDWSGLWRFAYSHSEADLRAENRGAPGYFNVGTDALGQMSDRASVCLYLRGDLAPATRAYAFETDAAALNRTNAYALFNGPKGWADAAWNARVAMTVPGAKIPVGMTRLKMSETHAAETAPFEVRPNPALRFDREAGAFAIDTPLTSGGFAPSGRLDCGRVAFELSGAPATVWASAVDAGARDLATAGRIAVFHLTDVQGDGNVYADEEKKILLKWGKAPSVVRKGAARISLALAEPAAYEAWSVRTDGSRLERLTAAVENGHLVFTAAVEGPEGARLAYEVVRK